MSEFDALPGEIFDALKGAGLNATVSHISAGTGMRYNTQTGEARPAHTTRTLRAPVTACKKALTDSSGLEAGDIRLTAPASAFTVAPEEGDLIEYRATRYTVVAVMASSLGDTLVSYTLQARAP